MGVYDQRARRRAKRAGRERGCWIYIPAEELHAAGIPAGEPVPWYRIWTGSGKRSVFIRLYGAP